MSYSPSQLTNEQKVQLQEVADGLLKIYETLAEMRYIDPVGIQKGPHDISKLQGEYAKHQLDPAIIYLYSILPYIDETEANARDFFHGGTFTDFRIPEDIERGRDPFYLSPAGHDPDVEGGPYMFPWYTALTALGNHGTVVLYDARSHRIWAIDQEGWWTTDPALTPQYADIHGVGAEKSDWGGDSDGSEDDGSEVSDSSGGSSEFWKDEEAVNSTELDSLREEQAEEIDWDEGFELVEDSEALPQESPNHMRFEHIRSRPAGDFLRDLNQWYRELKQVPGQGEYHEQEWMESEKMRPVYIMSGWPDHFDGDSFLVNQARAYSVDRAHYDSEEPLRQVQCLEGWQQYGEQYLQEAKDRLQNAKTTDEKWLARFELWKVEQRELQRDKELKEKRVAAERLCPGGVCMKPEDSPLWEAEELRVACQSHRRPMEWHGETEPDAAFIARERHHERKKNAYLKAYEAAKADAERLCSGRTFTEATGIRHLGGQETWERIEELKTRIDGQQHEIAQLRDWARRVPEDAIEAAKAVDAEIGSSEKWQERNKAELQRLETWVLERGNQK